MKIIEIYASAVSVQSEEYGTRAYLNSPEGRVALAADCPPDVVAEVLAVWGDAPTVEEMSEVEMPKVAPAVPTTDHRIAALEEALLAVMAAK